MSAAPGTARPDRSAKTTGSEARRIADALLRAQSDRTPIPPFTRKLPYLRVETAYDGQLTYHRWCGWISRHHPNGVDDGEEGKLRDYRASIPHGPGHFGGRYFLTETATGSQLRLASVCKVFIPLVGGPLEDLILHHIKQLFDAEEAFTADWITKHH